jgi:dihydroorotate dehydrogenase
LRQWNPAANSQFVLYQKILRPLLFQFPPEFIHHASLTALSSPLVNGVFSLWAHHDYPSLTKEFWGLKFGNPIGLAAGFDKNAVALKGWERLGFGFAEIGTVTPHAQEGNEKPRIFRLPREQGLINRMGFPNDGAQMIAVRLGGIKQSGNWPSIPIGINIGKAKVTPLEEAAGDYVYCFKLLRQYADYVVVNISSPNTPGLRDLQQKKFLNSILKPLMEANATDSLKPILVKITIDFTEKQIDEVLECVSENGLRGIICSNTSVDKSQVSLKVDGGLSGIPIRQKSTDVIRYIHKQTNGKLPIIGVGGIFTGDDAKEKLDAGADLLQIYTGFIYQGPFVVRQICSQLSPSMA